MTPNGLTQEQQDVISLPPGAWLVTAPPGCGKTEVLVRRVEHLLQVSGRQRSRVLVLTFTRRAAENVVDRIKTTLPDQVERIVAQRFHQFCHEVLRQQAPERVRRLYEGKAERLLALQAALKEEGLEPESEKALDDLLHRIELAKKTLAFESASGLADGDLRAAFDAYVRYQHRERICDFDDLILDVLTLFRAGEWPVSAYRQLYQSVLLDEAQDLNASQYALVCALVGPRPGDVMFFADHRQSIFAFNGSDLDLLEKFATDFGAGRRKLTLSFRHGRRIVAAANAVATHLRRTPDILRDDASLSSGQAEVCELFDEAAEAAMVADRIQLLLKNGLAPEWCHPGERLSLEPRDVAVMGRSRKSVATIEETLRGRLGDVVTSYGRDESLASFLGRSALWILRALAYPRDAIVRQQLLASTLDNDVEVLPATLGEALDLIVATAPPTVSALAKIALGASVDNTVIVGTILEALAMQVSAPAAGEEEESLRSDLEWLKRIRTQLRRKLQREPLPPEFTQELTMTSATPIEGNGVRVLTVHAGKGQEFRVVVIVGLSAGTFPSYYARSPKELDEERRLAYVAITRASRLLILTRPKTWVGSYGRSSKAASPYFTDVAATLHS
jgi:DNA helicase-2/ATP-dependent DNA helicase PcrA